MFTFLYFEAKNAAGHNNFEAKVLKSFKNVLQNFIFVWIKTTA